MACNDWKKVRNNFRVDQLIGLYIRASKEVQVYSNPEGAVQWPGWKIRPGQIMGRVWTWIDSTPIYNGLPERDVDGLYIGFEGGAETNYKKYYVKVEKGLIDWTYLEQQLTQQQKNNMNWYNGLTADFENSFCEVQSQVIKYGKIGLGVIVAYLVWDNYLKYEFLAYRAKSILKTSAVDLKQLLK